MIEIIYFRYYNIFKKPIAQTMKESWIKNGQQYIEQKRNYG